MKKINLGDNNMFFQYYGNMSDKFDEKSWIVEFIENLVVGYRFVLTYPHYFKL